MSVRTLPSTLTRRCMRMDLGLAVVQGILQAVADEDDERHALAELCEDQPTGEERTRRTACPEASGRERSSASGASYCREDERQSNFKTQLCEAV